MNNIPHLTIQQCSEQLKLIYGKLIENNLSFGTIKSPLLWGPPGIGKSTTVYELKDYIENKYHKHTHLLDLRLYEYSPVDLKGIPFKDESNEFTKWLKPKILDLDPDQDTINIIFLDELLSAKESVQAVALQLVLDRRIDQIVIPDNTIIIAASNRKEDRSFVSPMSMALADRFAHYNLTNNIGTFKQYAYQKQIDHRIIAFLSFHPSYLMDDLKTAGYAYCTPRSWEKVSKLTRLFEDLSLIESSIAANIGQGVAIEFIAFTKMAETLSTFEDIISGNGVVPEKRDSLFAIICMIAMNLNQQDVSAAELNHIYLYISQLPKDYQLAFLTDHKEYLKKNELKAISTQGYKKMMDKVGKYL